MKILIISPVCPIPADADGTSLIAYNLALTMSKRHQVEVLHFGTSIEETIFQAPFDIKKATLTNGHMSLVDYFIKPRNAWWIRGTIVDLDKYKNLDLIIVLRFDLGFLLSQVSQKQPDVKIIFYPIDLVSRLYDGMAQQSVNHFRNLYYVYQSKIIKYWEIHFFKKVQNIIFVSDIDARLANKNFGNGRNFVGLRNGAELPDQLHLVRIISDRPIITFSGDYSYGPNKQAASFIINDIANAFRAVQLPVEFRIVGRNSCAFANLAGSDGVVTITVTGEVENVTKEILKADIFCCPLFTGAGMKNKVIQALSIGLPVISSDLGVDGINEISPDRDFLRCNSAHGNDWRDCIISLARDVEKRKRINKKTPAIIKKKYTWDSVVNDLFSAIS